ncbi:electron transfer flavoprotein subunit alpha [Bradyrhizobium lupini HPC(L)]|uniref:Electron transfer flavoprotein subunit alpha n=1 Tax=Bradyrhizobium lupini HPC(L) TaxID=1229491 RepID=A0ABP2RPD7_RHILU|nr:electron transfer flavoprotein subunit alpha [Bradyrhizobium lupini HPC(L)]
MAILLLADHDNASLSDQTAKALTAASRIGGDVTVLVAGKGAQAAAHAAAELSGVSKVLLAESDELANNLAEPLADLIVSLASGYDTIISAATSVGKNVLPRVAALLDVARSPRSSKSSWLTPSSARSMPATPSRRYSRPTPRRS